MVTVFNQEGRAGATTFEFRGLSTDTKPTETYNNETIGNGSVFIEMDTEKILFYDADTNDWVGGTEE